MNFIAYYILILFSIIPITFIRSKLVKMVWKYSKKVTYEKKGLFTKTNIEWKTIYYCKKRPRLLKKIEGGFLTYDNPLVLAYTIFLLRESNSEIFGKVLKRHQQELIFDCKLGDVVARYTLQYFYEQELKTYKKFRGSVRES